MWSLVTIRHEMVKKIFSQTVLHWERQNLICSGQHRVSYFRSSPPEVFLSKGCMQICSKFPGEHPCGSVISEPDLNGGVMLLKIGLSLHPYITSSTKKFCGCRRRPECFVEVNMYQGTNWIEYYERNLKYAKDKLRRLQAYHIAKINKFDHFTLSRRTIYLALILRLLSDI